MNKCEMLHETVVRDIIDIINSAKDVDEVEWIQKNGRVGSISKQASNLILVFPVLVSNSISIQTASIITKAIERKCVSLLQILFASINITEDDNLYDFIRQFHSNLNGHVTVDDFVKFAEKMSESGEIEIINKDAFEAVKEDLKNINYYLDTSFNETSINDYISKTNIYGESAIMLEAKDNGHKGKKPFARDVFNNFSGSTVNMNMNDGLKSIGDALNNNLGKMGSVNIKPVFNTKGGGGSSIKDDMEYFKNQLLPQDVQKANELMPTLVAVNFTTYSEGIKNRTTGIIGVKAKIYPVDSMEIISRISSKYKDSNTLFNLIRATTREISFFRDFAFAVDKAKLDAVNMSKESNNAKIFKLLERRAAKNKFTSLMKRNDASPITSLVMSQEEVEYLKKYNNIDMEKSYITRSILEKYNLMDIVIADESLEVAKFLFDDGDGIYEIMPFDALEKEAKDTSYKKVINLMSKINH